MYSGVHALMLYWEDGDEIFLEQLDILQGVLEGDYNYAVLPFPIPSKDSDDVVADELRRFLKEHDKAQNFEIIYYGGHGAIDANRSLLWKWYVVFTLSLSLN